MKHDPENELIEAIYDAAVDGAVLDRVLAELRARIDASADVMFVSHPTTPPLAEPWHLHVFDAEIFADYQAHYHHRDSYIQGAIARGLMAPGRVLTGEMLVDGGALRRSALYNELLYPNDFARICPTAVHLAGDGTMVALSFFRPRGAEPFCAEEVAFLQRLVPHVERAARLRLRLERDARPPPWTLELLDDLSWAVVLLDGDQRPVVVNRAAEHIVRRRDGLRLDRNGLFAHHPEDAARLRAALARALTITGHGSRAGADLKLRRPSGAPPLMLTIVPLGRRGCEIGAGAVRAAVHIVDPASRPMPLAARLRTHFDLTPAEATMAQALAAGRSLKEYAEEARVTEQTARSRLKQVLAKTDARRQAELVRLVLASPAVAGACEADGAGGHAHPPNGGCAPGQGRVDCDENDQTPNG